MLAEITQLQPPRPPDTILPVSPPKISSATVHTKTHAQIQNTRTDTKHTHRYKTHAQIHKHRHTQQSFNIQCIHNQSFKVTISHKPAS